MFWLKLQTLTRRRNCHQSQSHHWAARRADCRRPHTGHSTTAQLHRGLVPDPDRIAGPFRRPLQPEI